MMPPSNTQYGGPRGEGTSPSQSQSPVGSTIAAVPNTNANTNPYNRYPPAHAAYPSDASVSVLTADSNSYAARSAANASASASASVASMSRQPTRTNASSASGNISHGYYQQQQQQQRQQPQQMAPPQQQHQQQQHLIDTEHQARLLGAANHRIKQEAFHLKRAMESAVVSPSSDMGSLESLLSAVLDRAVNMLGELCTSELTPKNYYEMHMRVLDQMQHVEDFLLALHRDSGGKVGAAELYQTVQYCTKVVPRSYLQVAAGSALIKSEERPAKQVLEDLIDCIKGVQCPLRGLFLRNYLLQAVKDTLPDSPGGAETSPGDSDSATPSTSDAYNFVLLNFEEMNKLWVRIQQMQASTKEQRKRRERERNELRILVGSNLVRLSQLEGVTVDTYSDVILPRILGQILQCKDTLAQAYLMDCIIQVFPDEFHIHTLRSLLDVCPNLNPKVNVRNILQSVMDRLASYQPTAVVDTAGTDDTLDNGTSTTHVAIPPDAFQLFDHCIQNVAGARGDTTRGDRDREKAGRSKLKELVRLYSALLAFSLNCYPERLDNLNRCLDVCADAFAREASASGMASVGDPAVAVELEKLLSVPLRTSLALQVLDLERYSDLLEYLPWDNRRKVALDMLRGVCACVVSSNDKLQDFDRVEKLFAIISPLLRDQVNVGMGLPGQSLQPAAQTQHYGGGVILDEEEKETGQLVAKLIQLLHSPDTDELFKMYVLARKNFTHSGKRRIQTTMLPLVYVTIPLVHRIFEAEFPLKVVATTMTTEELPEQQEASSALNDGNEANVSSQPIPDDTNIDKPNDAGTDADAAPASAPNGSDGNGVVAEADTPENTAVTDTCPDEDGGKKETDKAKEEEQQAPLFGDEDALLGDDSTETESGKMPHSAVFAKSVNCRKVFLLLQKMVSSIATHLPELGFKLYLEVALSVDRCAYLSKSSLRTSDSPGYDFGAMEYEFMSQAFTLYEDDISDSRAQFRCIYGMVGTLLGTRAFGKEDYEALITKATQYGAKLLKRPDQCRMVTLCSHLFFKGDEKDVPIYRNHQRVLECLQRALKVADVCMSSSSANVVLFVEVLDHYVFYFEKENPVITAKYVSGLIALINEHMDTMRDFSDSNVQAQAYYRQIREYITKKRNAKDTADLFSAIST